MVNLFGEIEKGLKKKKKVQYPNSFYSPLLLISLTEKNKTNKKGPFIFC